jgi:hypothetical protein
MMRGAAKYRSAANDLSENYNSDPEKVLKTAHAFQTAAWLWKRAYDFDTYTWNWDGLSAAANKLDISDKIGVQYLFFKASQFCLIAPTACAWYVVQNGDTPTSIATSYATTVNELVTLNGWTGPSQVLTPGESIKLWCN